jgi:hypothetical protein
MINDFDLLIDRLNKLKEETLPKWGIMSCSQMIFHCNTFIGVSLGERKINLIIRVFSRVFFRYIFLKHLISIDFDVFKSFPEIIDFDIEKNKLIQNLKKVKLISSMKIYHQMYGTIPTITLKKLVSFHTSYHLNQFGVL